MNDTRRISPLTVSLVALMALFALFAVLLAASCKTKPPATEIVTDIEPAPLPPAGVHLVQGIDSILKPGQPLLIPMSRDPFELIFPVRDYDAENGQFYAVKVLATNNPLIIDAFRNGISIDEFAPFSPGSGMAAGAGGYAEMTVTDYGHHYIFFDNEEPEYNRGRLLGDRDGRHVLSWKIDRVNYKNKSYPVRSIPAKGFTLIIFIDEDLDGIADSGEWYVADLRFTEY
jgi:hypothetical protein